MRPGADDGGPLPGVDGRLPKKKDACWRPLPGTFFGKFAATQSLMNPGWFRFRAGA